MVKSSKGDAQEKAANALKAKKSEDARSKKAAKKAATKAVAEESLEAHLESQKGKDEEDQQRGIDPVETQLVEMRELIGLLTSKQLEFEAKLGGQSAKIHALQMRHVATIDAPIDVDMEPEVDREASTPDGKDNLRQLDGTIMANYNGKHSNLRVREYYYEN